MVQDTGKFKLNNSFQNNVHYVQAKIACDMKSVEFYSKYILFLHHVHAQDLVG